MTDFDSVTTTGREAVPSGALACPRSVLIPSIVSWSFWTDPPFPAPRMSAIFANRIQRRLEFEERPRGSDNEGEAPDNRGGDPGAALTRPLEKTLHCTCAFASDELIQLTHNFPADRLSAEDQTCDSGGHEQYWRDREQRVVGERRAEAWCIVVPPGPECGPEYCHDHRRAH